MWWLIERSDVGRPTLNDASRLLWYTEINTRGCNWTKLTLWVRGHGCLDCRRTHRVKFTITIRLELQFQLFCYSSNQPLYYLQRQRFVQPLLQSGTFLVSTPVQLILTFKWTVSILLLVTVLTPSQRSRFACELTCRARYSESGLLHRCCSSVRLSVAKKRDFLKN